MPTLLIQPITQTRVRPPRLALLPTKVAPGSGLLFISLLVHAAGVFVLVMWLPFFFPGRARKIDLTTADILNDPNLHVEMLPVLPKIEDTRTLAGIKAELAKLERSEAKAKAAAAREAADRPTPAFTAEEEIVSDLPDATNNVQTIRRPDLIDPPKLKSPIRLQSMAILPAHAPSPVVAPQIAQPAMPAPQDVLAFRTAEPTVQIPALPINAPVRSFVAPADQAAPKVSGTADARLPEFAAPTLTAPKAVVVLSAVNVSSDSAAAIPDAELSGNFVVGGSKSAGSTGAGGTEAGTGAGDKAGTGTGSGKAGEDASGGNGTGTGKAGSETGTGAGTGAVTRAGSASGTGTQPGPGGIRVAAGTAGLPGISISGGSSGRSPARSRETVPTTTLPHRPYAITIVSGGSSGGASRDVGVFSRNDTVYTVYIPMADEGGGPDWSIQYSQLVAAPGSNGLLTPPVALKKVRAIGPKTGLSENSGPVFVTGVIDETGNVKALRAIRASDVRAQIAVNALAQWEFLPAQMDGKPVASKILIGVNVLPFEEAQKQN